MIYLLKSTLAFSCLFLLYELWFKRFTFFQFSRFYLLLAAVFSLVFPFLHWHAPAKHIPAFVLDTFVTGANSIEQAIPVSQPDWWVIIYVAGVAVMFALLVYKLIGVYRLMQSGRGPDTEGVYSLPMEYSEEAFSFFGKVFIGAAVDAESRPAVLLHERVHAKQLHSADILFFELLHCVFWFNPLYRLALKRLHMLHEFIADKQACGGNSVHYTEVLLARSMGVAPSALVHSMFNASYLKRRLLMLRKTPTRSTLRPVYLLALPLAAAMLLFNSFITDPPAAPSAPPAPPAAPSTAVPEPPPAPELPPVPSEVVQPTFPGGADKLMDYLAQQIKYPEEARKQKREGKVYIEFVVDETGKVKDASVMKSADPLLDAEALRVINQMPNWNPGTENGNPVCLKVVLPVLFKL
jgi:TonB family protein